MKVCNWGILGCGKIAEKFAEDLIHVPNANLYAVASRDKKKAEAFSKQHQANQYFGNYQSLIDTPEVDVIYIATPHVFHFEQTIACLMHHKAVLCEKPFAMNSREVAEMIRMAKEQNVFLMEGLWTHFLPHFQYILNIVKSGSLGAITHVSADFGFKGNPVMTPRLFEKNLGGGSLLDVGVYTLFSALLLLGYPQKSSARAEFSGNGSDLDCTITLTYENKVTANLYSSIIKETPTELIIDFEHGKIKANGRFHEPTSLEITQKGTTESKDFTGTGLGFQYEIMHVQEMLQTGSKESTVMTFEKSKQLMKLLDEIRSKIDLVY
ncbi:Gfo/Idh/MocA family oxidoreductase [Aquimarina sp. ERC-38]|uniref:Gfo/Idh/MocA family protein n=1 Tax=Aquimarina sp. ERC-38 TaxID=2949996 RepID=UPI002246EFAE|nr:Gfo/Idh/MocA family oxidoreductase [Aquimarina sp. ERC-38]UZO80169.1 Gfo/Idh/MocA family oxidoreductase [Aquimarina sp. ERC-38]